MYDPKQISANADYVTPQANLAPSKDTELHKVGYEFKDMAESLHNLVSKLESKLSHVLYPVSPTEENAGILRKSTVSGLEPLMDAKDLFHSAGDRLVSIIQRIGI